MAAVQPHHGVFRPVDDGRLTPFPPESIVAVRIRAAQQRGMTNGDRQEPAPQRDPLGCLLRRLDLRPLGPDRFASDPGRGEGRVYGGFLLAAGVVAAGRAGVAGWPHALHAQFLRSARWGLPLAWRVERLRDGFAFATRRVVAEQAGQDVIAITVGFTTQDRGLAHQEPMPDAPDPDGLPDWEDLRVRLLGDGTVRRADGPVELRECDPEAAVPAPGRPARRRVWMRPRGTLPDDPLLHAALLAYASDRALLTTAGRPHGLLGGLRFAASLDHALWLHGPLRFDGWLLVTSESPVASAGRALALGAFWRPDGRRIASVAQEGLIRVPRERRAPQPGRP